MKNIASNFEYRDSVTGNSTPETMAERRRYAEAKANQAPVTAPDEQERADAQFAAEYEAALAVGRRYEATGDVGVFFHATYR